MYQSICEEKLKLSSLFYAFLRDYFKRNKEEKTQSLQLFNH